MESEKLVSRVEDTLNYRLLEENFRVIVETFDWKLYNEILDTHKRRAHYNAIQQDDEELDIINKYRIKLKKEYGANYIEPKDGNYSATFVIDNNINALADADRYTGLIRFNLIEHLKFINNVRKTFLKNNIPPDKNLVEICTLGTIFHELCHLSGGVWNPKQIGNYSSIDECVTDFLSFNIMVKYMNSIGNKLSDEVVKAYYDGYFNTYEAEKVIFGVLMNIINRTDYLSMRALVDSFYWAHFHGYNVSSPDFTNYLPEEVKPIWDKFLTLTRENSEKQTYDPDISGLLEKLLILVNK